MSTERRDRLERAATQIAGWLEVQDPDEDAVADVDGEDLWVISALALDGAPEAELARAVEKARDDGWAWAPIALLLDVSPQRARQRFAPRCSRVASWRYRWGLRAPLAPGAVVPSPRPNDD